MANRSLNSLASYNRVTPEDITELADNEVFVMGTNESGIHGAGAAKVALAFGAQLYVGFGPQGNAFGIPTKDWTINTLPLNVIEMYVSRFVEYTKLYPEMNFLVTKIGCGLAGYEVGDIAPLFKDTVELGNVHLPKEFWNYLIV